ncbi:NUDIX domain-containing protein (plasmid) [Streptomyces viridifaciens]|nr:NUDIX domain-containing protein [Streptomyces viridifaciens]
MTATTHTVPRQAGVALHAALLLTDRHHRVLVHTQTGPTGDVTSLPTGCPLVGESPAAAATRAAQAATSLVGLDAGPLIAVDWLGPGTAPGEAEQHRVVHLYDGTLTASQVATLTADDGLIGGLRFLTPGELRTQTPAEARRVLAALHARVEGRTSELVDGIARMPGVLDRHRVLDQADVRRLAAWTSAGRPFTGQVREARGWLFVPDGRVLLYFDPATGDVHLPGGPLLPGEDDHPSAGLRRACASTVMAHVHHARELGHRGDQARLVGAVTRLAALASAGPAPVRLLATVEQALELTAGQTDATEVRAASEAARDLGFADPARQPITEVPSSGIAAL